VVTHECAQLVDAHAIRITIISTIVSAGVRPVKPVSDGSAGPESKQVPHRDTAPSAGGVEGDAEGLVSRDEVWRGGENDGPR